MDAAHPDAALDLVMFGFAQTRIRVANSSNTSFSIETGYWPFADNGR